MRVDKFCKLYTVKHIIGKLGLPSSTFYTRIARGWTLDEALESQIPKKESLRRAVDKITKYYSKGKSVHSQLDEKQYNTFIMRVRKGIHPREALQRPFRNKQLYFFEGKPIQEIFTKKSIKIIQTRMSRGWGIYTACTRPIEKRNYGVVWLENLERI